MDDIFELDEPSLMSEEIKREPAFLKELNPEQKEAVLTTEGPLLVLSGAGTGKTRVLTTRIAFLISQGFCSPWEILAVTFTNKASREMKERLFQMIGGEAGDVWLGTFHSIGFKILSRHGDKLGFKPKLTVLSSDDQERLIKKIMTDAGVDVKKYSPTIMLDIIQRWKDRGLMPQSVTGSENSSFCEGKALGFYQIYQKRLFELNAVDFGDLLLLPLELFKTHPEVLTFYQHKFKYLLVDEYQDTNVAQYLLLRLLAKEHDNLCCVGDDDQSIYSWRGAEVQNILTFKKVFPDAKIIRLERNYRSTGHILGAASALIAHNKGRLGKTLKTAEEEEFFGEKVVVSGYWNGTQEAQQIVSDVEARQRAGCALNEMAILVRAGFQTRAFEEELVKCGVPYKIVGGFKFYEREEIRDVVAYLRLVFNTADDLAFLRIVNKPRRGLGDQAMQTLQEAAATHHVSLFDAVALAPLRPGVKKTVDVFCDLIKTNAVSPFPLAQRVKNLLEETGYLDMWRRDKSPDAPGRIENIQELLSVLREFDSLSEFLEHAALVTDADEQTQTDQLVVMTLHASKGLEFDVVYLPGWEEGLFPHQRVLDEQGETGLEEERRLAYVGLTRARRYVRISFAANRVVYGQWQNALPSRFVDELPQEHIREENVAGFAHSNAAFAMKTSAFLYQQNASSFYREKQSTPIFKSKRLGKRVFHETFGYGTVVRDEGARVEVRFDSGAVKKFLAKFLEQV